MEWYIWKAYSIEDVKELAYGDSVLFSFLATVSVQCISMAHIQVFVVCALIREWMWKVISWMYWLHIWSILWKSKVKNGFFAYISFMLCYRYAIMQFPPFLCSSNFSYIIHIHYGKHIRYDFSLHSLVLIITNVNGERTAVNEPQIWHFERISSIFDLKYKCDFRTRKLHGVTLVPCTVHKPETLKFENFLSDFLLRSKNRRNFLS